MQQEKHPQADWYKLFSGLLCFISIFFLYLASQCFFKIDFACFGYGLLAGGTFVVGLLPTLLGIEHAKQIQKKGVFYYIILLIYLAGFLSFIALYVFKKA